MVSVCDINIQPYILDLNHSILHYITEILMIIKLVFKASLHPQISVDVVHIINTHKWTGVIIHICVIKIIRHYLALYCIKHNHIVCFTNAHFEMILLQKSSAMVINHDHKYYLLLLTIKVCYEKWFVYVLSLFNH